MVDAEWYEKPRPNLFLALLELLFRRVVRARRWVYRHGLKRVRHFPVPVVVVGNLTVGGTGKTPLAIWLAQYLREHGFKPGIVSRGYGVSTGPRPVRVSKESDAHAVGDEPCSLRAEPAVRCLFSQSVPAASALVEMSTVTSFCPTTDCSTMPWAAIWR